MVESTRSRNLRGCIMYFFLFTSYGVIQPYLPLIWSSKGLSEHEVGVLGAVKPLASFFVTPIACSFADVHGLQAQMLLAALVAYPLSQSTVLLASTFLLHLAVQTASAVSACPISSLTDSFVLRSSGADGFGVQRLWGAVGFGVASFAGGYVTDASGGGYLGMVLLYVAFMTMTLITSSGVWMGAWVKTEGGSSSAVVQKEPGDGGSKHGATPVREAGTLGIESDVATLIDDDEARKCHHRDAEKADVGGGADDENDGVLAAIRTALGSAESTTFFAAVGLSGMGMGVIDTFLFIWLEELGGSHALCGVARLIMCMAEVPFFSFQGVLVRTLGVRTMIAMTQIAYFTRFIYYSVLEEPWWVLPAEVLHGVTFAVMWTATTTYAHQIAPEHQHSTFQGLIAGIHWGFGVGIGALLGGVMYAGLGARACFGLGAILPSLSLLLLSLPALRRCGRSGWMPSVDSKQPHGVVEYELVSKEGADSMTGSASGDDSIEEQRNKLDLEVEASITTPQHFSADTPCARGAEA